jgi:sialate O-acetylesterase
MVAPLIPYTIKGVIWYQGESNGGRGKQYQTLFPLMISDWRQRWGEGNFPFLFVQIAPYKGNDPAIREAQLLTFKSVPATAMVVTTDIGDPTNIHPTHKRPVGERLALAARALAYGEKIEYSGPVFNSAKIDGAKVVISFTHVGGGLLAKDGPLKGFELAGADKKFTPAQAQIQGDTIIVTSAQVPSPAFVRYGYTQSPDVNLFNQDGLPASPFRTDQD